MSIELKQVTAIGDESEKLDEGINHGQKHETSPLQGVNNAAYIADPEKAALQIEAVEYNEIVLDGDDHIGKIDVVEPEQKEHEDIGGCMKKVAAVQESLSSFSSKYGYVIRHVIYGVFIAAYAGYFAYALRYEFGSESSVRLLWMTMLAAFLCFVTLIRDNFGTQIYDKVLNPIVMFVEAHWLIFKYGFIAAAIASFLIYIGIEVGSTSPRNLISLGGLLTFVLLLFVFSANPAKVKWQPVIWGLGLQFVFALLVLRTTWGYAAFKWLGDRITEYMEYADAGAIFVFGEKYTDHFFAMKVMPVVIFFSATISVLYYLGTMQTIIMKIAWVMQRTLGTTAAESCNAAGNIFIGQTEAPLLIRPMLQKMTQSELHAVMVGGYATIAGSVMATYILFGVPANHLISASIMAAPCALAMSKLFYPETEPSLTTEDDVAQMEPPPQSNVVEAAASGASDAVPLVANILANLIAFLSLLAFINTTLTWMGHRVGLYAPEYEELTFEYICSYVLWPFAFIMGVPTQDCRTVAELIGIKTFLNEFVAYTALSVLIDNTDDYNAWQAEYPNSTAVYTGRNIYLPETNQTLVNGIIEDRTETIATYALCGFANVGSIGTVIGALSAMAPNRASVIARLAVRAMIAGNVVSFMNACTAGLLYNPEIV